MNFTETERAERGKVIDQFALNTPGKRWGNRLDFLESILDMDVYKNRVTPRTIEHFRGRLRDFRFDAEEADRLEAQFKGEPCCSFPVHDELANLDFLLLDIPLEFDGRCTEPVSFYRSLLSQTVCDGAGLNSPEG